VPIATPRLLLAVPALVKSDKLFVESKNEDKDMTVGTATPPVLFAQNECAAIGAKEIVPVAVIGPPTRPVPVLTCVTPTPPAAIPIQADDRLFQYSYSSVSELKPRRPL
jgi:hypothetical protein